MPATRWCICFSRVSDMNKYECCEDCYFNNREPAICDDCDDGDQFEPEDMEEGAMDTLRELADLTRRRVIPIARFTEEDVRQAEEEALKEAA